MSRIVFLCREGGLTRERAGLARALEELGVEVVTLPATVPDGASLKRILSVVGPVDAVLEVEAPGNWLPHDLHQSPVVTGCLHFDNYMWPERRARWSTLFDTVFIFHPVFENLFRTFGNSNIQLLGHSAFALSAHELIPHSARQFDVGFVGRTDNSEYSRRRRVLQMLDGVVLTNDWRRPYPPGDVMLVYCQSRIVLNVGRNSYPSDVSLRGFEAMAAGSLLATCVPSELSLMGFEEGVHFVGFRRDAEVLSLVKQYLADEPARLRIAAAGRQKLAEGCTWIHRARTLLESLSGADRAAPARTMTPSGFLRIYLDYYIAHKDWPGAFRIAHRWGLRDPAGLLQEIAGLLGRRIGSTTRRIALRRE